MINDYVTVKNGRVINLGFEIDVFADKAVPKGEVISGVISSVTQYFDINKWDMGDNIYLSQLVENINNVAGVLNVTDLRVYNKVNENGIILYAGINEYDIEIFKIFIPKICLNQFYYNCGKVFVIDRFVNLFDDIKGYIIFVNGDVCNIYKFESKFIKIKSIKKNAFFMDFPLVQHSLQLLYLRSWLWPMLP